MKKLLFIIIAIGAMCLVSCSSNTKNVSVTDVQIYGDISYYADADDWFSTNSEDTEDYLTIENGNYKFYIKDNDLIAEIPIKVIKTFPDIRITESEISIAIGDKNEELTRDSNNKEIMLVPENLSILGELVNSKVGNKTIITFKSASNGKPEILNKIEKICLFADLFVTKNTSKTNVSSSSNENWDAVLDSYEKYVDNYISYVKKVAQGDISAMTKMASLLEDAEELSDRLDNASDDLSSSQAARYMRITSKLTEAMANL